MKVKELIKRWKRYAEMSNLGEIARRKFVNNCFDGILTCAGIVSGFFIVFLDGVVITTHTLLITGLATALAIGISGLWGAYLSEEAERSKKMQDITRAMGHENPPSIGDPIPKKKRNIKKLKEMAQAMGLPEAILIGSENPSELAANSNKFLKKNNSKKPVRTINEQAEHFATIVASLVDGLAPVMGSFLPLIPFFFGTNLTLGNFISSYCILVTMLVFLGLFLGRIAGNSGIKYVLHLVLAGVVTLAVSLLLSV